MTPPSAPLLAAIERSRRRLWSLCYRMLGERSDADDVCQEAIARAIERADQLRDADPTGWLLRIATRACLDQLRRRAVRRRATALVDPLMDDEADAPAQRPDERVILREDLRFAVVVALQHLPPRQRAALVLADVCDRPLAEVAEIVGGNVNGTKALLHRARAALARARGGIVGDVPVDPALVRAFADALEQGSIDALARLMADDVWGVVDGGGVVKVASRPSRGRAAAAKRFANVQRRLGAAAAVVVEIRPLNGEPALVVRLAVDRSRIVAVMHLVTRSGAVAALLIDRDPRRLRAFGTPLLG